MTCQRSDWEVPRNNKESRNLSKRDSNLSIPNHENRDLILAVFLKTSINKHACKQVWRVLCLWRGTEGCNKVGGQREMLEASSRATFQTMVSRWPSTAAGIELVLSHMGILAKMVSQPLPAGRCKWLVFSVEKNSKRSKEEIIGFLYCLIPFLDKPSLSSPCKADTQAPSRSLEEEF